MLPKLPTALKTAQSFPSSLQNNEIHMAFQKLSYKGKTFLSIICISKLFLKFDWFLLMFNWRTDVQMMSITFVLLFLHYICCRAHSCLCSAINDRRHQNVVRMSVTNSAITSCSIIYYPKWK